VDDDVQPRVSVILLAWRVPEGLSRAVAAVRAQVGAPAYEIVVVENGATPDVREAVRQAQPDRIVSSETNLGFGQGCNLGVASSTGEYVVLLNDDAEPDPGWLRALVSVADSDATVGGVGSLLLNPDGTLQEAGSRVLPSGRTFRAGAGSTLDEARAAGLLVRRDIDYGSAAALLLRRTAFDQVGGFDPRYTPAYYEDVDFSFRLHLAGWRVVFEPGAVVRHDANSSTRSNLAYLTFLDHRSLALFQDRWREVLEQTPPAEAGPLIQAPITDFGVVERPVDPAPVQATSGLVHPDVAVQYEAWLADAWQRERARAESAEKQLDDALQGAARLLTNHEGLSEEHRLLHEQHAALVQRHEDLDRANRLVVERLQKLENGLIRRTARAVLKRR